jgi:hypothetical protein
MLLILTLKLGVFSSSTMLARSLLIFNVAISDCLKEVVLVNGSETDGTSWLSSNLLCKAGDILVMGFPW